MDSYAQISVPGWVRWCAALALMALVANAGPAAGQGLPLKVARTIAFTTHEGTWMSLDVSPDGHSIVFDMLGDIYLLPIEGGKAKRLTNGLAYAALPRFSPNGNSIAFLSDRSGSMEPWVMAVDGSGLRRITPASDPLETYQNGILTTNDYQVPAGPVWSMDGQALLIRRHSATSGGRSELWSYPALGGPGEALISSKDCAIEDSGAPTPDGRRIYVTCGISHFGAFALGVFDTHTKKLIVPESSAGTTFKPLVSPDGRWLAYASRMQGDRKTTLWLKDLTDSAETQAAKLGDVIQYATLFPLGQLPGYAFTPDSHSLIVSSDGKIKRIDLATHAVTDIPFVADVKVPLAARVHEEMKLRDGPIRVQMIDRVVMSDDGSRLAFSAVGKIWLMDIGGQPKRLTAGPMDDLVREFDPVFSPDGKWVVFASWSDISGGHLCKVAVTGGVVQKLAPTQIDDTADRWQIFGAPHFTPDGRRVAFLTSTVQVQVADRFAGLFETQIEKGNGRIGWIDAQGGQMHLLPVQGIELFRSGPSEFIRDISIGADDDTVYFWRHKDAAETYLLQSISLDSTAKTEPRTLLQVRGHDVRGEVSPDGRWLAAESQYNVGLLPIPVQSSTTSSDIREISAGGCAYAADGPCPHHFDSSGMILSREGGQAPRWSKDGQWLVWNWGNTAYRARLQDVLAERESFSPSRIPITLRVPQRLPSGQLLLRGGRLITMAGDQVLEHADILISGRRIKAIGPVGSLAAPGAKRVDVSGKTIVPGLFDLQLNPYEASAFTPFLEPIYAGALDYGVTTSWSPAGTAYISRAREETRMSGRLYGPRSLSGGDIVVPSGSPMDSEGDALHAVRAAKAVGAVNLQFYAPWRRIDRQRALLAAQSEHVGMTAEGGKNLQGVVEQIRDGFTGIDHFIIVGPLKHDVVELFARSGTYWDGTIPVNPAYIPMNFLKDPKNALPQARLFPVDGFRPPSTFSFDPALTAEGLRDVLRAGGVVVAGSDEGKGSDTLLELLAMSRGGMTNAEVLRCATINGARAVGMDADLGSIEQGKIADLIVLNSNPIENLRALADIQYVIQDGFMYQGGTLAEVWPEIKPYPIQPWQRARIRAQAGNAR